MSLRSWFGEKLVALGTKILDLEAEEAPPTVSRETVAAHQDDEDGAPYPPVAMSAVARKMLEEGRQTSPHFRPPPVADEPLRGSAQDRIAKARARHEMG